MGNLIKVLTRDIDNNAGNFFLDFESRNQRLWPVESVWICPAVSSSRCLDNDSRLFLQMLSLRSQRRRCGRRWTRCWRRPRSSWKTCRRTKEQERKYDRRAAWWIYENIIKQRLNIQRAGFKTTIQTFHLLNKYLVWNFDVYNRMNKMEKTRLWKTNPHFYWKIQQFTLFLLIYDCVTLQTATWSNENMVILDFNLALYENIDEFVGNQREMLKSFSS